ncbi:hypothetical protein [Caballeronia sp. LZ001]|uniref:hypothetical protein n=1 Tax=Caballeronia sp. LZ001 TaxID=3038553 RepID=UPI002854239B|nr:hypothetical protein [Caballeronia sp. LZ001]MDR5801598.1 hypothetical protein [Caballeronia sp. LZ001]
MNRIVVTDSATLTGPWEFVPNEGVTDLRQQQIERMENAWRTTDATPAPVEAVDREQWLERIYDGMGSSGSRGQAQTYAADESGLSGPDLLAHRMSNAWRLPPRD